MIAIVIAIVIVIMFVIMFVIGFAYFYRRADVVLAESLYCDRSTCIYSPAFGRILHIDRDAGVLCIYLSLNDVHRQYFPVDGDIVDVVRDHTGQFSLAYDFNKSRFNEKVITTIDLGAQDITVSQIAGMLVRRIVNTHTAGDRAIAGQEMGMICFGSRVDVQLPPGAQFVPELQVGQKIQAGDIIASRAENLIA